MQEEVNNEQERTVPVIEEELVTGTRRVKTGSVRIRKTVQRVHRTVDIPTVRDAVEVTRKAINEVVTVAPEVREEGDTLIIPVLEEEVVVTKRLVLREEIHIRRSQTHERVTKEVAVGREVATIDRLDAEGNVTAVNEQPPITSSPEPVPVPPVAPARAANWVDGPLIPGAATPPSTPPRSEISLEEPKRLIR